MPPLRPWPAGPAHRLPQTVAPLKNEAVSSYVARLAHANHITAGQLRQYVAGSACAHPRPEWLAVASSQPERVLLARLRGLRPDDYAILSQTRRFRPMCRLCMARRGIHEPVYCALAPHVTACQRHQLWIGPPASTLDDQKCLHDNALVLAAARLHERLGRRFGDPVIRSRIREARRFLTYWANCEHHAAGSIRDNTLAGHLAIYPLIGITATLAIHHRHVQQRSIGGGIAWPTELLQQINDRTGHTHTDTTPIEQWIHNHRLRSFHHRVPGRPSTTHENLSEGNARC